ncbi:hypothetical protein [uncultured Eubacterium sp.]|uniref:hypothetical protein n=1 Tax=uncultured Eubacterium sp. TaxID=165185 RepID=UPI002670FFC8|nr:hypothetical protein [uncultured Eubacterium sp.]
MMDELLKKVKSAFHEEHGEGAKIEEWDKLVFELNDSTLILSCKDGMLKEEILEGKPIRVDYTTGFFER